MKQLLTLIYALSCFFSVVEMQAQNESTKWYFGVQAGLDFMTNPPTILTNGALTTSEGCSSIADAAGNLVLYTDGSTVYNNSHVAMANGTGLVGFSSSSQSGVIVKQPGNANIFYVFSQGSFNDGTRYSTIDMNLAAGQGSVTSKNIILKNPSSERLTLVKHCNGIDVWVMTHDYLSNVFRAYLVTSGGVNPIAITSTVGVIQTGGDDVGILKFSPNAKKLAMTLNGGNKGLEIFDFDPATGIVSNPFLLASNFALAYGLEFSPDGTKLYATSFNNLELYQWNLCAGNNNAIAASLYLVTTTGAGKGQLQLAPNGKIYVARYLKTDLGVINNPNVAGSGCNYVELGQLVFPKLSQLGLPNFAARSVLAPTPFTYTVSSISSCQTLSFTTPPAFNVGIGCWSATSPVTGFLWYFGEPSSGAANTSTLVNPVHIYSTGGTYTVKLVQYGTCNNDTIKQIINIGSIPALTINGPTSVCSRQTSTLTALGADLYSWNSVSLTPSIVFTASSTVIFTVVGTNTINNCQSAQTITVTTLPAPSVSVTGNFSICSGEQITLTSAGADIYSWSTGNTNPSISVSPAATDGYTVTGTSTVSGCSVSRTVSVNVSKCLGLESLSGDTDQATLYPNPFTGRLNIEINTKAGIRIYDHLGRLVYENILQKGNNDLNLSSLREGIFFARILTDYGYQIIKLIREE